MNNSRIVQGDYSLAYTWCTARVISMPSILVDSVAAPAFESESGVPSTNRLLRVSSRM